MVNGINSSQIPYGNYPYNAVGATPTTKDIASMNYDTQKTSIAKTYAHLTSDNEQSLIWPIVGTVVSFLSLVAVGLLKRR